MTTERLSERNTDVGYDRSAPPSIVHLGVGAFARAHLAVYADDLLRAGHPAMIRGVSLRSRSAEDQLGPQDGLFAVDEREPGRAPDAAGRRLPGLGRHRRRRRDRGDRGADHDPGHPHGDREGLRARSARRRWAAVGAGGPRPRPRPAPRPGCAAGRRLARQRHGQRDAAPGAGARGRRGLRRRAWPAGSWSTWPSRRPSSTAWSRRRRRPTSTPSPSASGSGTRRAVVAEHHRSWYLTATDGLPPLADVGVAGGRRHRAVPVAQALAAQRPALGPRLHRAAGRLRDHRRGGGPPRRGAVRPAPGRRHPRGGGSVPGHRAGGLRRGIAPAVRQPGARPHLPPGRRRRLAQAGPAPAARRQHPAVPRSRRRAGSPSSSPSGWPP